MAQVIVVGGGLSGLSAAHTLYERGCNVLVLDKNPLYVPVARREHTLTQPCASHLERSFVNVSIALIRPS